VSAKTEDELQGAVVIANSPSCSRPIVRPTGVAELPADAAPVPKTGLTFSRVDVLVTLTVASRGHGYPLMSTVLVGPRDRARRSPEKPCGVGRAEIVTPPCRAREYGKPVCPFDRRRNDDGRQTSGHVAPTPSPTMRSGTSSALMVRPRGFDLGGGHVVKSVPKSFSSARATSTGRSSTNTWLVRLPRPAASDLPARDTSSKPVLGHRPLLPAPIRS